MSSPYKYILFDWDGCLAKTLEAHLQAYQDTFAEYDMFPSPSLITHRVFGDWQGPAKLGVPKPEEFTQKYLNRLTDHFINAPLYPNAFSTLQTLARSKKLALLTSSTSKLIHPAIEKQLVAKFFSVVITAEDVTEHKPAPEIITKALTLLQGQEEEAIIIGDSKSDLGAAQNAGIDSVLFFPEHHSNFYEKENLLKFSPTHVISDHSELLDIFE